MSWRKQQLEQFYNNTAIIEQDARLIKFVQDRKVKKMCMLGESDIEYFQERLPGVEIYNQVAGSGNFMLAVFRPYPFVNFENFLNKLQNNVYTNNPDYVYVAINKYGVTTELEWSNLTDDYDSDLLTNISKSLKDYQEIERNYKEDLGQYFNFAHPTTNVYYERIHSTNS
jgi:hypothetical protein